MFRAHVLIVRWPKLYIIVSGIITPIGGRPVHMCSKHVEVWNKLITKFSASSWLVLINKYIEMHGQQNIKKKNPPDIWIRKATIRRT